jgi:hypothetical protein
MAHSVRSDHVHWVHAPRWCWPHHVDLLRRGDCEGRTLPSGRRHGRSTSDGLRRATCVIPVPTRARDRRCAGCIGAVQRAGAVYLCGVRLVCTDRPTLESRASDRPLIVGQRVAGRRDGHGWGTLLPHQNIPVKAAVLDGLSSRINRENDGSDGRRVRDAGTDATSRDGSCGRLRVAHGQCDRLCACHRKIMIDRLAPVFPRHRACSMWIGRSGDGRVAEAIGAGACGRCASCPAPRCDARLQKGDLLGRRLGSVPGELGGDASGTIDGTGIVVAVSSAIGNTGCWGVGCSPCSLNGMCSAGTLGGAVTVLGRLRLGVGGERCHGKDESKEAEEANLLTGSATFGARRLERDVWSATFGARRLERDVWSATFGAKCSPSLGQYCKAQSVKIINLEEGIFQ